MYEPQLALSSKYSTDSTLYVFMVCGIIMIVCSTFVVLFFLLKKGPIYLRQAWKEN